MKKFFTGTQRVDILIHRKFGHGARLVSVHNVNVADDYVDAGDNDKKKKGFRLKKREQ